LSQNLGKWSFSPRLLSASWRRRTITHYAVELAALVALRSSLGVLGLACAELSEVLGCLGGYVCEELHFDAAEGFSWYEFDVRWSVDDARSAEFFSMSRPGSHSSSY